MFALVQWIMAAMLIALLLSFAAPANPSADSQPAVGASYQTKKSLAQLEKCLTDKLSERGDVTSIAMPDGTTLMLDRGDGAPMLIDLEPPAVKVTTRFAFGTRTIVERCL
jgi:hypothetical protein